MLRRAVCLLLVGFFSGCGGPSYPKEKLAEGLVELCRKEYGLEVKAQLTGTTLGCMAMIPGLIDELRKQAGANPLEVPPVLIEGRYEPRRFDFRLMKRTEFTRIDPAEKLKEEDKKPQEPAKPIKQLQQVSTAMHRVALSTDANLEFYRLIARDPSDHLDVIFSGHIMDSKRVQFYAISMGELQNRSEFGVRLQPEGISQDTVAGFFLDVRRRPLPQLLSRYTSPTQRFGDMLPKFLAVAVETKGMEDDLATLEMPALQVGEKLALVYVPLAPIGGQGAILFTVELQENGGAFSNVEILPTGELPEKWSHLVPPEEWGEEFYLEAMSLPIFLAEQVAKRVAAEFRVYDPAPQDQPEGGQAAEAPAEPKKRKKNEPPPKPATLEDVARVLAETAAYVFPSYEFNDFEEILAIDGLQGTRWSIPAEQLPLFRRKPAPELNTIP